MSKTLIGVVSISLTTLGWATAASAHDASQVRRELRERGYYQIQFIEDEAPFQVNAYRDGERFHLHIDWYGQVTERTPLGPCGGSWWRRGWRRSYEGYGRYRQQLAESTSEGSS